MGKLSLSALYVIITNFNFIFSGSSYVGSFKKEVSKRNSIFWGQKARARPVTRTSGYCELPQVLSFSLVCHKHACTGANKGT